MITHFAKNETEGTETIGTTAETSFGKCPSYDRTSQEPA